MTQRITKQVVDSVVCDVGAILACYGLSGATISGERIGNGKNTTRFNGRLVVRAAFPTGHVMTFWAHDASGLLKDAVRQSADAEYDRWLWQ